MHKRATACAISKGYTCPYHWIKWWSISLHMSCISPASMIQWHYIRRRALTYICVYIYNYNIYIYRERGSHAQTVGECKWGWWEQVDADSMGMMKHIIRMRGNHKEDRCCDVFGAAVFKCAQCIVGNISLRVENTFRLDPTIRCKTMAWLRLLHSSQFPSVALDIFGETFSYNGYL